MEDLDAFAVDSFAVHPANALPPDILLHALSGAPGSGFLQEAWNPDVIEVTEKVGLVMAPANLVGPPPVDEDEIEMFLEDALNEPSLGVFLSTEMVIQADRMPGLKVVDDPRRVRDYFFAVN